MNIYTYQVNQQTHTGKICFNIYCYHLHVSVTFATIIRLLILEH